MGFYENKRDVTVLKALKKRGKAMLLVRKVGEVFSGASGGVTSAGYEETTPVNALFVELDKAEIDGTLVTNESSKVMVQASGLAFVPEAKHRLKDGDTYFTVSKVQPLSPGGVDLLYYLYLNKA